MGELGIGRNNQLAENGLLYDSDGNVFDLTAWYKENASLSKGNESSTANSTVVLLTSGATFTGAWEDVTNYTTVACAVLGSIATDGILYFDLSTDNGATFTSIPNMISDATFAVPRILNVVEQYVRIRYVNGTTAQTGTFSIQTKYSNGQELALLSSVDGSVTGETPTQVVKAVLVGVGPDGDYLNVPVDEIGQLAVNVHDQTTRAFDFFFGRLDNVTTLAAQADPEDLTLTLTATTGFTDGKSAAVFAEVDDFYIGKQIGAPAGSVISLDTPVDIVLPNGSAIAAVTTNMAVDGSVTTQIFQIGPTGPGSTAVTEVTRIMGHILDSTAMDDGKFGGMTALTNGVVFRKNDGVISNYWNVKTNADLALLCYNFQYSDKAPGGQFGANFRNTYAGQGAHGVVLELLPGEYLEILIQDDLTALDEFTMMAQGHFRD
jgi:hypothetical protein